MRYLRLLSVFYKYSILQELEYRVNFLANAFMSVFWVAWSVVSIGIFFQHRDRMGDWTYPQVLVVVGLFTFFHGVLEALLRPNVGAVVEQVRIVPIAFVTTFPASALFGILEPVLLWYGIVAAGVLLVASNRFWNFAVRHYSSASS